jgi:glycosyltransferase involved in cell wall biosynthesis
MKVLLGHNFYRTSAPSGEDAVVRNERQLLERGGVEVVPFEKYNDDIDESSFVKRVRLALDTSWSKKTYNELRSAIRHSRPDLVHFHNTFPQISPSAYAACRDSGVPVVQTLHNYRTVCANALLLRDGKRCEECLGGNPIPALQHRCYRGSLAATSAIAWTIASNRARGVYNNLVDTYIALSDFAAKKLADGGLPVRRIVVKPNFLPDPPPLRAGGGGYAVYVGRLSEEKGVRTLISAWELIDDVPLVVVGDGSLRAELEQQVHEKRLNVKFTGFLDKEAVFRAVGNAMLQVIPSECYENFPMVILEAFACGTPVLVSGIGSMDEIVDEGVVGFKFEPGNKFDLARKVKLLARVPDRLAHVRELARQKLLNEYSAAANFEKLLSIYEATLASKERNEMGADKMPISASVSAWRVNK